MFHNLLWRAPATEYKDTSNTQWIVHRCQALQWNEQFLSIHLDEIIPANPLITGYLFPVQNSLPDTWRFAVLHYGECINALVIRENYSFSPYAFAKDTAFFWPWPEEMVKMTVLIHVNWNKVKVKEDQQNLHHKVQNINQLSMLLALPEAQECHY